jgi:hypothetical protein
MEVRFVGANRRKGVSEKTGREYDIAEVVYMVPDEPGTKKHDDGSTIWSYACHGCKVQTVPLHGDALSTFGKVQPGDVVSLKIEPDPRNPRRTHVIGIA